MGIRQVSRIVNVVKSFSKAHPRIKDAAIATTILGVTGGYGYSVYQLLHNRTSHVDMPKEPQGNVPESEAQLAPSEVAEQGTVNSETDVDPEKYIKTQMEKGIHRGEDGDTIGAVVFQKGLVKKVEIQKGQGLGISGPMGDAEYVVTLADGSELSFLPQYATNQASVAVENGELVCKGLNHMYFMNSHYDEKTHDDKYSNLGKYKFLGCTGFVNTVGQPGETVTTGHRRMNSGTVQESRLWLCDKNYDDKIQKTENDLYYGGN